MRLHSVALCTILILGCSCWAQGPQTSDKESLNNTLRELQSQIRELQASVRELRDEAERYRVETLELRNELAHGGVTQSSSPEQPNAIPPQGTDQRLAKVQEDIQLLNSIVDEHDQTKVESASKYRVRLSGIVLFNMLSNRGVVDNIDNPALAERRIGFDSTGTFGGTLRQSIIGWKRSGLR